MLILSVEKAGAVPVYRQICDAVVRKVDDGTLAVGDRLPATRVLARTLGVHRSTVLRAYEELWALGYLESRPGSYSTVRRRARGLGASPASSDGLVDWASAVTPAVTRVHEGLPGGEASPAPAGLISFARLVPDPRLAPNEELRRALKAVLVRQPAEVLDYGDAAGYRPLRETIARRLRTHGVTVSEDEVVVTNGAQQGIDLALRVLAKPSDNIVTETPTYSAALRLFDLHDLEVRGVSMTSAGMDLDLLEQSLAERRPALVYTIPNFHNPTGVTTDQAHRERLLAICETHGIPLLEDGFEEEMKYFGRAVLPIKAMDARGIVIYIGTFSKVLFPGLRVGWIAAPRGCADRLRAVQQTIHISNNGLAQAAFNRLCRDGAYEAHLRRIHKTYRKRLQAAIRALRENLPVGIEWTPPVGGYTVWLRLPPGVLDEAALDALFRNEGVALAPGRAFFVDPPPSPCFRLSLAAVDEAEIHEGCRRLGRALVQVYGRRPRP